MYILTHALVWTLLPIGVLVAIFVPSKLPKLKTRFVACLFKLVGKDPRIQGLEHIQQDGSYLVIANYPSFYAGFALIGLFPRASVVAHAFMQRIPLMGFLMGRMGTVFVRAKRGTGSKEAIDFSLKGGHPAGGLIILPEGQRTEDGLIHTFKRGFIYILRQTDLDLLPISLNGFYQLKPVNRFYLDPDADPEIVIHPPISNEDARSMHVRALLQISTEVIQSSYQP